MEELFRFSVIRATTKTQPTTTGLSGAPAQASGRGNAPPTGLQQQIIAQVQSLAAQLSGEDLWNRLIPLATTWLAASGLAVTKAPLWAELNSFLSDLTTLGDPTAAGQVNAAEITAVFANHPSLTDVAVTPYRAELSDLFMAFVIVRRVGTSALDRIANTPALRAIMPLLAGTPTLVDVAATLGACDLFAAGAAALVPSLSLGPAASRTALAAAVIARTTATLILPNGFASALRKPQLGVGFRELQVVKQHIRRYDAAEIARIDNILKGEQREHWQRHTLSTESDTTVSETTSTETDKELDTNDHTDVQSQANDQVRTDTKLDAGAHASYSSPSYKLQADLTVSYDKSDQKTQQYSTDTAKDVTKKAVTKVTDIVTRTQTTKVIEAFLDRERQRFDNTQGTANISGLYQWIEKIYLCQMFNLGRHMLIDVTVPEPGANLLAMATVTSLESPPPVQPHPLGTMVLNPDSTPKLDRYGRKQLDQPLNPLDLSPNRNLPGSTTPDPNFYGVWVGLYGASGVSPPPATLKSFSEPLSFPYKDDNDPANSAQVQLDDGYASTRVNVSVTALSNDNPQGGINGDNVYVNISVAGQTLHLPWPNTARTNTLTGTLTLTTPVSGTVSFDGFGHNIDQMDINVEFVGTAQPSLVDQWRLQTYENIVAAYQSLDQAYEAALAAARMSTETVGPLGATDPDVNALTARIELKRTCIAIFDNNNATVSGNAAPISLNPANPASPSPPLAPDPDAPQLPEPNLAIAQAYGARVRWFEEAFEWENMAYVLYPYYWGRRSQWVPNMALANGDPEFLQFLQAGYARVVVPVRLGFETAMQFFLNTGLPWLGGDLPTVGDDTQNPLYLDVAEEIKALTGGGEPNEVETPVGDPWEYVLPTTLMKLRDGDDLPEWHRTVPAGDSGSTFASDAPDDVWTWADGPPSQ